MCYPIGEAVPEKFWSVRMPEDRVFSEGVGVLECSPIGLFLDIFPMRYLPVIVRITTDILHVMENTVSSTSEVLKFFRVLVLMIKFDFARKTELCKTKK